MVPDTDYFYSTNPYSNCYENMYLLSLGLAGLGVYAVGSFQGRIVAWMCPTKSEDKISFPIKENVYNERVNEERISKEKTLLTGTETQVKSAEIYGFGKHKQVYTLQGTLFVLKVAKKYNPNLYKNEYIAYLLSEKLGLGVVPFVSYVDKGTFKNPELLDQYPNLKGALVPFQEKYVIIQGRVKHSSYENLNAYKAHTTLFFNLIAGRSDQKKENSIVDGDSRVWEIDNDQIGDKLRSDSIKFHWLKKYTSICAIPIAKILIDHIVTINSTHIENAIKNEWDETSVSQVINNLTTLQSILQNLTTEKTVKDEITFDDIMNTL